MFRSQRRQNADVMGRVVANTRIPELDEVGAILVRSTREFAVRHKYITGWYLLGLLVLGLLSFWDGRDLSPIESRQYNEIMNSIDMQAEYDALDNYMDANARYRANLGWFWSCNAICKRYEKNMHVAKRQLDKVRAEGMARISDAKAIAGLNSKVAVHEIQDSFSQYLSDGKRFAKRQTAWDVMFMGLRSIGRGRDEKWAEYALKIVMYVLINFTFGLLTALAFFVVGLWNILRSYQPNPMTAVVVFVLAAAAATSFVVSYLLAMVGAAAAGVYGLAKMAESSNRQRIAQQQQQERLQRPHYD